VPIRPGLRHSGVGDGSGITLRACLY
jgi:hypothetical protein